jgi:hypothetical protein
MTASAIAMAKRSCTGCFAILGNPRVAVLFQWEGRASKRPPRDHGTSASSQTSARAKWRTFCLPLWPRRKAARAASPHGVSAEIGIAPRLFLDGFGRGRLLWVVRVPDISSGRPQYLGGKPAQKKRYIDRQTLARIRARTYIYCLPAFFALDASRLTPTTAANAASADRRNDGTHLNTPPFPIWRLGRRMLRGTHDL